MKHILVISELNDYVNFNKLHFSMTKGFYFSKSLSKLQMVYYVTTGKSTDFEGINLINIDEINDIFMEQIKYIILIRETNLTEIIDRNNILNNIFNNKKEKIIAIKSDSIDWINDKHYKKYFSNKNINFIDFILNTFDVICCQTQELKKHGLKSLEKYYSNDILDKLSSKIFISKMGIPNEFSIDDNIENPYNILHNYCVNYACDLKNDMALHPLHFISPYLEYSNYKLSNYNKKKTILIYTGRIKMDGGKIIYLLREIMKKLGDDYELHIFPGRFIIPDFNVSVLSPKNSYNLQLLRDIIFYDADNVIIHYPYDDKMKAKYIQYADIGLDFSQSRPNNIISNQGNAKLLEYCYYGIKVVCENNINNSDLIISAKNGILLPGVATSDQFVEIIKKMKDVSYDKKFAINTTIINNNWDKIAQDFFEYIEKL